MNELQRTPSPQDRSRDEVSLESSEVFRLPPRPPTGITAREHVEMLTQWLSPAVCRRLGIYTLPDNFVLSVVVPIYNEESTIAAVIERIRGTQIPVEIILVNDGSSDGSARVLEEFQGHPDIKIVTHTTNQGKGAALRSGFAHVAGDVVIIQDADLEYDPDEYMIILQPLLEDWADVVYGSRFTKSGHQVDRFWHQNGNRMITLLSNLFTNLKLTDVETCYKAIRRELIQDVAPSLQEKGFGIELELTAKLAKRHVRFYEVPISYRGRTYAEGKKINWRDALRALWCILKY